MASETNETTPSERADTDLTTPERRPSWPDWFDRWTEGFPLRMPELFGFGREGELIRIEESVDDDGLTIRGELPGLDPDNDVEVTVDHGRLTISAERRQSSTSDDEGKVRSEFRYGSYRRTVTLPPGTDTDAITATYDDGILEIRVPVARGDRAAAKIPVGRGD